MQGENKYSQHELLQDRVRHAIVFCEALSRLLAEINPSLLDRSRSEKNTMLALLDQPTTEGGTA